MSHSVPFEYCDLFFLCICKASSTGEFFKWLFAVRVSKAVHVKAIWVSYNIQLRSCIRSMFYFVTYSLEYFTIYFTASTRTSNFFTPLSISCFVFFLLKWLLSNLHWLLVSPCYKNLLLVFQLAISACYLIVSANKKLSGLARMECNAHGVRFVFNLCQKHLHIILSRNTACGHCIFYYWKMQLCSLNIVSKFYCCYIAFSIFNCFLKC